MLHRISQEDLKMLTLNKKIISIILTITLLFSTVVYASASNETLIENAKSAALNEPVTDFFEQLKFNTENYFKDIKDKIVFMFFETVTIENNGITVSFSSNAFGDEKEYRLYVKEITFDQTGKAPAGYSDYMFIPANGYFEPVVYRIAILDELGNTYNQTEGFSSRIYVNFSMPDSWFLTNKIACAKYVWSDDDNKHNLSFFSSDNVSVVSIVVDEI